MIKFNNFNTEYNFIKSEIDASISRVISSGWYILGIELSNFEKLFSKYLNANYCVGVGSGTDALTISLMSLNIGKGDEVITTSITAYPTITGILYYAYSTYRVEPRDANDIEEGILSNTNLVE